LWLSGGERLSDGIDLAQDVFALCLPHVPLGIFVARRQKRDDGIDEFSD
jgi:hypothetical protein